MESTKIHITKLNNANYQIWKYKLELLLIKEDLWSIIDANYVTPATTDDVYATWKTKDGKARAHIGLLVEDNQLVHIRRKNTAKDMWNALREHHEKSSLSNKVRLLRRLCRLTLKEGGDMEAHLNTMDEIMDELTTLGETMAEPMSVALYLSSLPESYSTMITALETRPECDLNRSMVKGKLLDESCRRRESRKSISSHDGGDNALQVSNRTQGPCFFCKENGHIRKDCRKYKQWKKQQKHEKHVNVVVENRDKQTENDEVNICLKVGDLKNFNCGDWCIDSGASSHMCNDSKCFVEMHKSNGSSVTLADGRCLSIAGTGIVKLKTNTGCIQLNDVIFVPQLNCNLLSVGKLAKSGCDIVFKNEMCQINLKGKTILIVRANGDVYKTTPVTQALKVNQTKDAKCVHEWHRILGHRNLNDIKNMTKLVRSMHIRECEHSDMCETCLKSKLTRDSFPKESATKTHNILDLVHTDVCGPIQLPTPRGNRYILTLIDDFSRYTHIYLLKVKSEVKSKIMDFVSMTNTQYNRIPKVFRSDRGGEYMDAELKNFFKEKGICTQLTTPKTPQQNGVAERKNRSLIEMVRCMLASSELHKQYWGEAVTTANFLANRLPTKNKEVTPYELWHGRKPDIMFLHEFGMPVYAHIPKDQRKKLDNTAEKLIFVGYEIGTKGYRLLNVNTHKIRISRDVKFDPECKVEAKNGTQVEISLDQIQPETFNDATENESESNETEIQSESEDTDDEPVQQLRRSSRSTKGIPPSRLIETIQNVTAQNVSKDPTTFEEAMNSPEAKEWKRAMDSEINSLHIYGTWEIENLPPESTAIGSKWVYKRKTDRDDKVIKDKARLVAQRFSQIFVNPTTLKILLTIAGQKGMAVRHFDIESAYLNGDLSHQVYMKQPKGYKTGNDNMVCKLVKNLYGLKQGANEWNRKFDAIMRKNKYIQSKNDTCLYTKKVNEHFIYLTNYVDDIVATATNMQLLSEFENEMTKELKIKNLGELNYYLGIQFERDEKGIFYMYQEKYILNKLQEYCLADSMESKIPMNPGYIGQSGEEKNFESNETYRSAVGSLLYLSTNTRPDIAISTSIVARKVSQPNNADWNEVKRIFRYLKLTSRLKLKLGSNIVNDQLVCYVDADWAGDTSDRKSNTGFCLMFNGTLIGWCSRKQTTVALSSTEAEFVAFSEAAREAIWVSRILQDFNQEIKTQIKMFEDNQGCIKMLHDRKGNQRTKYIDVKYMYVKDLISNGSIKVEYCSTKEMIADLLTKPLDTSRFTELVHKIGLIIEKGY